MLRTSAGDESMGVAGGAFAFVRQLGDMGPRAASAVRDLAKTLDRAQFDVEIAWQQPSRATRRVTVTAATAAHMAATVEHANLDEQPVEIIGEYLTVSAVSSWLIQRTGSSNDTLTVKLGRIDPGQTRGLAVAARWIRPIPFRVEPAPTCPAIYNHSSLVDSAADGPPLAPLSSCDAPT
ncbi:hypothetical protein [Mycobacteroides chelonae]|uniref:hypothetical protein n=1 Tax=Mycobacteroides chelonae TaxID=1774 RepID=UPI0020B6EF20|nr:hypothetical protein [Mycobacteroides chelonae]